MKSRSQQWEIPKNLDELIATDSPDGDGMSENESWDPMLHTVMAGSSYGRRSGCVCERTWFPRDYHAGYALHDGLDRESLPQEALLVEIERAAFSFDRKENK